MYLKIVTNPHLEQRDQKQLFEALNTNDDFSYIDEKLDKAALQRFKANLAKESRSGLVVK